MQTNNPLDCLREDYDPTTSHSVPAFGTSLPNTIPFAGDLETQPSVSASVPTFFTQSQNLSAPSQPVASCSVHDRFQSDTPETPDDQQDSPVQDTPPDEPPTESCPLESTPPSKVETKDEPRGSQITLFLEGLKMVRCVRAVFGRMSQNYSSFLSAYKTIVLWNVVFLLGFHLSATYLLHPALCHFFGDAEGMLTGSLESVWRAFYFLVHMSLLLLALHQSESAYQAIAKAYYRIKFKREPPSKPSLTAIYFSILTSIVLAVSQCLSFVPYTAPLRIFMLSLLYSFYAFNLKIDLRSELKVVQRVVFFDQRLMFFFGFGLLFTLSCFFFDLLVSNMLYSLLFPFLIMISFELHPQDLDPNPIYFARFFLLVLNKINACFLGK